MDRIINELMVTVERNNGGALLQLNTEETKSLLKVLKEYKEIQRRLTDSYWDAENNLQAERNQGHEQGQ